MNPWKVSAQFAAYVWYTNSQSGKKVAAEEAARFARENWVAFLPYAQEGLGRLLIEIGRRRPAATRRRVERVLTSTERAPAQKSAVA